MNTPKVEIFPIDNLTCGQTIHLERSPFPTQYYPRMRTFIRFRYQVCLLIFEFLLFTFLFISILPNSPSSQSIKVFQFQLLFSKLYKYKSDTSIAFSIVGCANQTFDPDLRGNFWEPLLDMAYFNDTIHYIGDNEFTVNGVTFIDIRKSYNFTTNDPSDRRLYERVSFSYKHFIDHHPNTKWYFKGGHDTFRQDFSMYR